MKRVLGVLGYAVFLLAIVAAGSEAFLRYLHPESRAYRLWPPHYRADFVANDSATPGVSGTGRFIANSLGLRSEEPPPDRKRTVYVLGGSTAIDVYLDQEEAWTQLLQNRLNEQGQPRTWVGNLAKSSLATVHNLLIFEYLIPSLPRADLFVNLLGVNDLQLALKSSFLRDMTQEMHMRWTFTELPETGNWWKRLALVRFARDVTDWNKRKEIGAVQTFQADGFNVWRKCRQTAPADRLVDSLPDLGEALDQFRKNLNLLADRAESYGARMMFLTQPVIWSDNMDPQDAAILLAGGLGPNNTWCEEQRYFTPRALAEGLAKFNAVTLEVCELRRLPCVDLAAKLPRNRSVFYDDMHFNEEGARQVAHAVAPAVRAWFEENKALANGGSRK